MERPEAEFLKGLLALELYVIETGPAVSERTRAVLADHIAHQIELERQGILFAAGPLYGEGEELPSKGMVVIRAKDFDDAKRIADSDPFHQQGIRSYSVRKWIVNEGSQDVTVRFSDQSVVIR